MGARLCTRSTCRFNSIRSARRPLIQNREVIQDIVTPCLGITDIIRGERPLTVIIAAGHATPHLHIKSHTPMNQPQRHHYLPEFYLQRWAAGDGRVFRYHRPHRQVVISRLPPKYTGFEKGLYTLEGETDAQIIETKFFSLVDNAAAPVLKRLILGGPAHLNNDQRNSWARFVMSLQLRGPESLAEIKEFLHRNTRTNIENADGESYQATKRAGDPDSVYDFALREKPELFANAHKRLLPQLIDHEVIGEVLINMRWAVMNLSAAPHTLLTGDRPYTTSHGLGDPLCLLGVPLSPTHLFVAGNNIELIQKVAAQRPKDAVRNANSLMTRLAVQSVYGNTDSHLTFVEKRLRRADEPPVPGVITRDT